jgi:hypothetical protein
VIIIRAIGIPIIVLEMMNCVELFVHNGKKRTPEMTMKWCIVNQGVGLVRFVEMQMEVYVR